jgi:hypothetical protein
MPFGPWICGAALLHAVALLPGDAPDLRVVLALDDQANEIWSALPDAADDQRVLRLGHTPPACADHALRRAKEAIEQGQAGRIALRTLSLDVRLPRSLWKEAGAASTAHAAELFGRFVSSENEADFLTRVRGRAPEKDAPSEAALRSLYATLLGARSDHALQPLLDLSCPGAALYEIRALPDRPGRLFLHMMVEAGCACGAPSAGQAPRRFRVLGQAELEPGTSGYDARGVTLRWRVKSPRYTVLASCPSCGDREPDSQPTPAVASSSCGLPCSPLKKAAAGWAHEVSAADRQVETLSANVRSLEAATAQNRKDLQAAQSAVRQPAGRVAALRRQLEGAQAELAKATRLAGEARERAGDLRRAAEEARATDARCEAQCQAKQQPPDPAQAAAPGGGAATGGGVSTTALVIGGAALAGAGAALVATSSESAPQPQPLLEGEWAGTALHDIEFQGSTCVRALDESWSVRRSGDTYTVAITRQETCNGAFTCPQGCLGRAFPALTVTGGTVDGNRFTFPTWYDVFFGPKPCPVTGTFDAQRLQASSTGPCTVLVTPEGPVLHQYRMMLNRR